VKMVRVEVLEFGVEWIRERMFCIGYHERN